MPGVLIVDKTRIDAEITAIDTGSRLITMKTGNGNVIELVAGPDVRNFAQLRVGDRVGAEYQQVLSMNLKKGGGVRSTVEDNAEIRAKAGEKPGGAVAQKIDFVADVTAVDKKASTVTLLGARGNVVTLKINDKKVMAQIKKGDQVEGSYVQLLAILVTPNPAAAK